MPAFSRFLRYFVTVGRLGSIRRAAEELNVSASAIDRQILRVEEELGMPLFERRPSGLRLTAAGELMMASGLQWQKGLGDVLARMEDLRGLRRGHVEIALIDALSKGFLPGVVSGIQAEYPGISVGLTVLDNGDVRAAIASGRVDFGIMLDPQSSRDLTVRAHVDVVLGFVTRPDHPFAGQASRRFANCSGYRMVAPAEPLALCRQIAMLEAATDIRMDVAASADNIQMIKSLVIEGVGVGVLTSLDVTSEIEAGELTFTRIADPAVRPLTLALCVVPSRQMSIAANLVLHRIESMFNTLGHSE
jgi:DNA-binding transcriptional LysR family regulator